VSTIDPLRLAQFMVLPGAAELVEAFASLPPGELRDSAVSHVQVLARTTGWNPPPAFGVDARPNIRSVGPAPKRLPSPFSEGLAARTVEGQIVERALRGESDHAIAADLGVKLGLVVQLKRKARKEGGLTFPGDEQVQKFKAKSKASKKGRKLHALPVPPGPWWWEDPDSPVWENHHLLPSLSEKAHGSMAAIGPHDVKTYRTMELAAARHNMTLRAYIAQRLEIVRRVELRGERPTEVAIDMRVSAYAVYGVLSKVGRGRMETVNATAAALAEMEPEAPPHQPTPESPPAAAPAAAQAHAVEEPPPMPEGGPHAASALAAKKLAAARWGFPDVTTYEHARVRVRDFRLKGWHPMQIEKAVGQPKDFVKATLQYWRREQGVTFPAAPYRLKNKAA
jgi:hypothetical protein